MVNSPKQDIEALKAKRERGERLSWFENMKLNEAEIVAIAASLRAKRKGY